MTRSTSTFRFGTSVFGLLLLSSLSAVHGNDMVWQNTGSGVTLEARSFLCNDEMSAAVKEAAKAWSKDERTVHIVPSAVPKEECEVVPTISALPEKTIAFTSFRKKKAPCTRTSFEMNKEVAESEEDAEEIPIIHSATVKLNQWCWENKKSKTRAQELQHDVCRAMGRALGVPYKTGKNASCMSDRDLTITVPSGKDFKKLLLAYGRRNKTDPTGNKEEDGKENSDETGEEEDEDETGDEEDEDETAEEEDEDETAEEEDEDETAEEGDEDETAEEEDENETAEEEDEDEKETPSIDRSTILAGIATDASKELGVEEDLNDPTTARAQAFEWFVGDGNLVKVNVDNVKTSQLRAVWALAVFYFSTGGQNWLRQFSFLASESVCDWGENQVDTNEPRLGVTCNSDGKVSQLRLTNNGLSGTIPEEISLLSQLTELHLGDDPIGGMLPATLFTLENLQVLRVEFTSVEGSIPTNIGQAVRLRVLSLFGNLLSGSIPASTSQLAELTELNLSANDLQGRVPNVLNRLQKLEFVQLYNNRLSGRMPAFAGAASSLLVVDVSENLFRGPIPASYGTFSKLFYFYAYNNRLDGPIPFGPQNLLLQELDLYENRITGEVPDSLWEAPNLVYILLGKNALSGNLPSPSVFPPSLFFLSLNDNAFEGTISKSYGEIPELYFLSLHSNLLEGGLPEELGNAAALEILEVGNNKLTGEVPASFANLQSLDVLSLERTELQGDLDFLCSLGMKNIAADCGGEDPDVTCTCCQVCCTGGDDDPLRCKRRPNQRDYYLAFFEF